MPNSETTEAAELKWGQVENFAVWRAELGRVGYCVTEWPEGRWWALASTAEGAIRMRPDGMRYFADAETAYATCHQHAALDRGEGRAHV